MNQDIAHKLFIRFGLSSSPGSDSIERWSQIAEQLIAEGFSEKEAGHIAAQQVFPDYNSRVYLSQADTIEALLAALRNR